MFLKNFFMIVHKPPNYYTKKTLGKIGLQNKKKIWGNRENIRVDYANKKG